LKSNQNDELSNKIWQQNVVNASLNEVNCYQSFADITFNSQHLWNVT